MPSNDFSFTTVANVGHCLVFYLAVTGRSSRLREIVRGMLVFFSGSCPRCLFGFLSRPTGMSVRLCLVSLVGSTYNYILAGDRTCRSQRRLFRHVIKVRVPENGHV